MFKILNLGFRAPSKDGLSFRVQAFGVKEEFGISDLIIRALRLW